MQQNHQASGCFLFNLMSWAKVLTASIIHMSQNLSSWSYVLIGSCDSHSSRPRRHHLRSHDAVAWFVSPSSLSVCAQAARSAASDAWAACPGPPSSPPSSSTWAWPCSVGVATRLWAARSPSSRTTLKWSGPPETRWMCSPCEQFVHLLWVVNCYLNSWILLFLRFWSNTQIHTYASTMYIYLSIYLLYTKYLIIFTFIILNKSTYFTNLKLIAFVHWSHHRN